MEKYKEKFRQINSIRAVVVIWYSSIVWVEEWNGNTIVYGWWSCGMCAQPLNRKILLTIVALSNKQDFLLLFLSLYPIRLLPSGKKLERWTIICRTKQNYKADQCNLYFDWIFICYLNSKYTIPRRGALNGWIMISFYCQEMACLAVYSGFITLN